MARRCSTCGSRLRRQMLLGLWVCSNGARCVRYVLGKGGPADVSTYRSPHDRRTTADELNSGHEELLEDEESDMIR